MRINLGIPAFLSDGFEGPQIDRVIVDPRLWEVTHVVVGAGEIGGKIVPLSLVRDWAGDRIDLMLSRAELEMMPDYVERHYATPQRLFPISGEVAEVSDGAIPFVSRDFEGLSAIHPGEIASDSVTVELAHHPVAGPVELRFGASIESGNHALGRLDQLVVDTYTHRVTDLVARSASKNGLEARFPVEMVAYVEPGCVRLALQEQTA